MLVFAGTLVAACRSPVVPQGPFTVAYDGNGATSGTVPAAPAEYQSGSSVLVAENSGNLARSGSSFGGWNTRADGGGTTFVPGASFTIRSGDVTLYARWTSLEAAWARVASSSGGYSSFAAVAADASGRVYAVGSQQGTVTYSYGSGITATGTASNDNAVIVAFDTSGNAVWAVAAGGSGTLNSEFLGVAVDAGGTVYAVGYQESTASYVYGSASATGDTSGDSLVVVSFDSNGNSLWATTVSNPGGNSRYNAVTATPNGDIVAAGFITGTTGYTLPDGAGGLVATGGGTGANAVITRYLSNGNALWASPLTSGAGDADFLAVAADPSGNLFASGFQTGTGAYGYSGSVNAFGSDANENSVVVKYDSSGNAQWAQSVYAGTGNSTFAAIAADPSGEAMAVGFESGSGPFSYDSISSVTATGGSSGQNAVIVKYGATGAALWARSVVASTDASTFTGVAADGLGNALVVGAAHSNGVFDFGNGTKSIGSAVSLNNAVIVKYNASGSPEWVHTVTAGSNETQFSAAAVDGSGRAAAAGLQTGSSTSTYGPGVTAPGTAGTGALLVQYAP